MVQVKFYEDEKTVNVVKGTTILQAARFAGVSIESPCNAAITCGKCKVKLHINSINNVIESGNHHLNKEELENGFTLACGAKIMRDITVEQIPKEENKSLKILESGKSFDIQVNALIKKKYFSKDNITKIYAGTELLGIETGDTSINNFGVVIDIGTTTLVVCLLDLNTGKEISSTSALNPQAMHAQDVLSRIKLASEPSGLATMYSGIINQINEMISIVCQNTGADNKYIYEAIFSGNTCMLHLAANINPFSLGKYPYTPEIFGGSHIKAKNHQINISSFGIIYLPPIISAYVGADITSGILASQLYEKKGITLFVDIGTNGEMVIGIDGRLSAASTAAGPAFEGMNITKGMRAGNGAIEFFNIEEDEKIKIKTIGNIDAIGICGSGLLDIVGELVKNGIISKNGKLIDPDKTEVKPSFKEKLVKQDGKTIFKITDKVYLTQKDIRQVQLAKGAIRAGIEFLLKSIGIKASQVDKVLIAGSFGYHLRAKSLINIGLLPSEFEGKVDFIGNTSKSGGEAFLLNVDYRIKMEDITKNIQVIELASYKDFDKVFVECLGF